jgi:hypothetical protein
VRVTLSHPHGLVIVLDDSHLEVQTSELAQVSVGVTVFGTENRTDLEYPGVIDGTWSELERLKCIVENVKIACI